MRKVFATSLTIAGVLFMGQALADGSGGGKRPVMQVADGSGGGKRPVAQVV